MTELYKTTDEYHLYKLKMNDHAHDYRKADTEQPKGLDHIKNSKYQDIIEIINNDAYRYYDAEINVYYNTIVYLIIQFILCMYCSYKYFMMQESNNSYLIGVIVMLLSNFYLHDICEAKLAYMMKPITYRINRNIEKYSKKNDVQWRLEVVLLDDTRQLYLKYYIYRQVYDPIDPLMDEQFRPPFQPKS